jgi:hypothetical protein
VLRAECSWWCVLQIVSLLDGTVIHCSSGHAGRQHDSTVFWASGVVHMMEPGFFLLGDGAYQGLPGVLAPFRRSADAAKTRFNEELRSSRVRAEHAINAVKQQWSVVRERARHSDRLVISVAIHAACALTNYLRRVRH